MIPGPLRVTSTMANRHLLGNPLSGDSTDWNDFALIWNNLGRSGSAVEQSAGTLELLTMVWRGGRRRWRYP